MTGLDARLRRHIYDAVSRRGMPPSIADLVSSTSELEPAVRESLTRLAAARVIVLQPTSGEILMAPPFSAVPTPFLVETAPHRSHANCAWDAIGIPIMLGTSAHVVASCGCCGDRITMNVSLDAPPDDDSVVHFAVPAARWWDDIVFT